MTKKKTSEEKSESAIGEQLTLIEVGPENEKEIGKVARFYEKLKRERMALGEKEVEKKTELRELVQKANLKPLADGTIRFKVDKLIVTLSPGDWTIKVKEEDESNEA